MIKCIKKECPKHFETDNNYKSCQLASKDLLNDECIGIEMMEAKREEIVCKISKLMNEYCELAELEKYIKEKQEVVKFKQN